jgi:BioD-like phosphotransacetylase family protein
VSNLFIGATGDHAGRSLVTWAIGRRLKEAGYKVGFIKPFGTHPVKIRDIWTDQDALLLKDALNLKEPFDQICPFLVSENSWRHKGTVEILDKIKSLVLKVSRGKDIILIMGSKHIFYDDSSYGVSDIFLNTELQADFILVTRYQNPAKSIYSILSVSSLLKDALKGTVINRVMPEKIQEVKGTVIPSLERRGIPQVYLVPEDPVLSYRRLGEIRDILNGEFLWGEESSARPVCGMTVGSSSLKGDISIFKRLYNKIVLLGPKRPEEVSENADADMEVAGVLLTGDRRPAHQILEAAEKAGIPLIIVKTDTFSSLEQLEREDHVLSSKDEIKIRHFTDLMAREEILEKMLPSLKLIP